MFYLLAGRFILIIGVCLAVVLFLLQAVARGTVVSLYPGLLPSLVLMAIGWAGLRLTRHGKRLRIPSAERLLEKDHRPPVLYLRSFRADNAENPFALSSGKPFMDMVGVHLEVPTEEEDLSRVFSEIGPFIAVGSPDEKLPALGASRLYVANNEWQRVVGDLVAKCRFLVLRAGNSPGFLWELDKVVKSVPPSKVLLYLPFSRTTNKRHPVNPASSAYEEFRKAVAPILPHPLPEAEGHGHFIRFGDDWMPELVPLLTRRLHQDFGPLTGSSAKWMRLELIPVFDQLGIRTKVDTGSIRIVKMFLVSILGAVIFLAVTTLIIAVLYAR